MWCEWDEEFGEHEEAQARRESPVDFDFFSLLSQPKFAGDLAQQCSNQKSADTANPTSSIKDYYKILEVDYDATEEAIRSNFIRLALSWHPDKKKEESATSRFQEINEAYKVLSDPVKRREYDEKGVLIIQDVNAIEYLKRHKGLILTCNGLGIRSPLW